VIYSRLVQFWPVQPEAQVQEPVTGSQLDWLLVQLQLC